MAMTLLARFVRARDLCGLATSSHHDDGRGIYICLHQIQQRFPSARFPSSLLFELLSCLGHIGIVRDNRTN